MMNRFKQKRKHSAQCACSVCQTQIDTPLGYGSLMPTYIEDFSKKDMKRRVFLTDDICVLDEEHFFVNGCLELPIIGEDDVFTWNVWVSLSADNFFRMLDAWEDPARVGLEPMFGWFSTDLPDYPDTINLKTNVHIREVGMRPFIELEPTDHPLAVEQREGISRERIEALARSIERREQ
ncbi:DUF2199 domain-containing protein [Exiguobacterium sp. SH3S2]|uniref:DUF2199 domain-containing protein n=1 Tax=unclassified Exiguobacterium TaxID=2644629 RepID=UPI00103C5B74|nr:MULTISPECIES: DUF2199 domain-containing protein [unclassified Exiguobacterium]TCI45721.1 DUF2199 domain-containing protein [Exiguobacterium sp. SH3S3]TCI60123.1 DUF2199 domain-containing protein [Exiguobacterium sp. SH3S1]TCI60930.1 DUF2199 domain-containing protein [Exiguobacterium sp. SH3S2]